MLGVVQVEVKVAEEPDERRRERAELPDVGALALVCVAMRVALGANADVFGHLRD